jgi:hypothetical protein
LHERQLLPRESFQLQRRGLLRPDDDLLWHWGQLGLLSATLRLLKWQVPVEGFAIVS